MPSTPPAAIFSFLKETRGAVTWSARDLEKCLKIAADQANRILAILEMQGYVQKKAHSEEWLTTASGESVSGSKLPRLSRQRVEEALRALSERIAIVNRDRKADYKISRAVAFGDFLSDRPQVQAADVGIELTRRAPTVTDEENQGHLKKQSFLNQLRDKSRFLQIHLYQKWMGDRSHRDLL